MNPHDQPNQPIESASNIEPLDAPLPRATARVTLGLLLLMAAVVALAGLGDGLPMESHEAMVARSADLMRQDHAYLVPMLNGEPRLKKPPLNYWLAAWPTIEAHVSAWRARVPSAVAGVAMVGWVIVLGAMVMNQATGLLAGAMMLSSVGYFSYTHSARPEMVYASLSLLGTLGWLAADRWQAAGRSRASFWACMGGWLVMGLAALSKGPQLPLIIAIGLTVGIGLGRGWRHAARSLRPARGLVLFLAAWTWWYLVTYWTVPEAPAAWEREALLHWSATGKSLWHVLDPYYLTETAVLIAPWVLFYIGGLILPWRARAKSQVDLRKLWWVVAVAMGILTLSRHHRWYYMLPVTGPVCVLAAAALLDAGKRLCGQGKLKSWRILIGGHVAAMMIATVVVAIVTKDREHGHQTMPIAGVVAVLLIGVIAIAVIARVKANRWSTVVGSALIAAVVAAAFSVVGSLHGSLWDSKRYARAIFDEQVATTVGPTADVYSNGDYWKVEQHYLQRDVTIIDSLTDLPNLLGDHDSVWFLVRLSDSPKLTPDIAYQVLAKADASSPGQHDEELELWRVTHRAAQERSASRRTAPAALGPRPSIQNAATTAPAARSRPFARADLDFAHRSMETN